MSLKIVLLEPEIPQNTGNIARTCVCTGAELHLIKPLGFSVDEKQVKRAGLDYWDKLKLFVHESYDDFRTKYPNAKIFMATTKARHTYADVAYDEDSFIMFGKESAGIPEEILLHNEETCIRIPMSHEMRSLNLSNAVAIILYEGLRQQDFRGLQEEGQLHNHKW